MSLFIGNDIVVLDSIDSTNNYAQYLINNNKAYDGTVVLAKKQFAGKGQRGKVWHSTPGLNLSFSIILKEININIENQFFLNMAVANGLSDFFLSILDSNHKINIKWPNDLLVDSKKICGVLIENTVKGDKITNSIIGIGINVNQVEFNLDNDSRTATSLKLCNKIDYELETILKEVLSYIEKYILKIRQGKINEIANLYDSRLYLKNKKTNFLFDDKITEIKIMGVNPIGKLIIKLNEVKEVFCDLKDIKFLE